MLCTPASTEYDPSSNTVVTLCELHFRSPTTRDWGR